jgi:hypothetical protein
MAAAKVRSFYRRGRGVRGGFLLGQCGNSRFSVGVVSAFRGQECPRHTDEAVSEQFWCGGGHMQ